MFVTGRIVDAWHRMMGNATEVDVVSFVDEIMRCMPGVHSIHGKLSGQREVAFAVDTDVPLRVLESEPIGGKFRMVCARLATVMAAGAVERPPFYGGRLDNRIPINGDICEVGLEFVNRSGEAWFRLTIADPRHSTLSEKG